MSDDSLDSEIQHHLDQLVAEYEARGMSPADARNAARRAFGNVQSMKERHRDQRGFRWLEDVARDIRYALRGLRRNPGFTAVALLTLAFGIGANTALFAVIDAVMLKPLPVGNPGELRLITVAEPDPVPGYTFSYPVYQEMRQQAPAFAGLALFGSINSLRMTTGAPADVEGVSGQVVSGNFFSVLGIRPAIGRLLDDADDRPGAPAVAVLSDAFWTRRFGREPSIVGRAITVNNVPLTVVGVAPRSFVGIDVGAQPDFWFQVQAFPQVFGVPPARFAARGSRNWRLIARVRPEVNPMQAQAQADAVWETDLQDRFKRNPNLTVEQRALIAAGRIRLEPAGAGFSLLRWQFRQPLLVLLTVVGLVLLIACANVANLLLARAASRSREMAVRMALGSDRARLIRQQLVESVVLAGLGGLVAIGIALYGGRIVAAFVRTQELNVPITVDLRLLGFTLAISLAAAAVAGVIPAVAATRLDLARRDGRTIAGPPRLRTQHALVVAQVALSIVVLVAAGLFLRTLTKLQAVDIGYERDNLTTASLDVAPSIEPARRVPMYREILNQLNAVPGQRAAISLFGVLSGNGWSDPIRIPGEATRQDVNVQRVIVTAGFFDVAGMRILAGRPFTEADDGPSARVVVVNETLARQFFRGDAVGRQLSAGSSRLDGEPLEIIGVVRDSVYRDLRGEADAVPPTLYLPAFAGPASGWTLQMRDVQLQVRTTQPADVESNVRRALKAVNPAVLVTDVRTMQQIVDDVLARERLLAQLAGGLAVVALVVGAIGIYGVRSYAVNRRTSELGVRLALGATAGQISRAIVKEGAAIAGIGIAIGLLAAAAATRLIGGLLFGVTPLDLPTFAAVAVIFASVAVAASYIPARRAMRIDPVVALRVE